MFEGTIELRLVCDNRFQSTIELCRQSLSSVLCLVLEVYAGVFVCC